jgi:hypothetical protein
MRPPLDDDDVDYIDEISDGRSGFLSAALGHWPVDWSGQFRLVMIEAMAYITAGEGTGLGLSMVYGS